MEENVGTYELEAVCDNCGERRRIVVDRGVLVKDVKCSVCGCKALNRIPGYYISRW